MWAVCHSSCSFKDWASFIYILSLLLEVPGPGAPRGRVCICSTPGRGKPGYSAHTSDQVDPSLEVAAPVQRHELSCPFYLLSSKASSLSLKGHSW